MSSSTHHAPEIFRDYEYAVTGEGRHKEHHPKINQSTQGLDTTLTPNRLEMKIPSQFNRGLMPLIILRLHHGCTLGEPKS